jgi:hypothetical protein
LPIEANSDNDNNDEMRGSARGRLMFSYDCKLSLRMLNDSSPNTWHEQLAVWAVIPDQQQQLEGLGAGEEHKLYVAQYIDDVGLRGHESQATLTAIGRVLGLCPTVATTTALSSSLSLQVLQEEAQCCVRRNSFSQAELPSVSNRTFPLESDNKEHVLLRLHQ